MTPQRASALDIGVVFVVGLGALWALGALTVGVSRLDLFVVAGAVAVLAAAGATLAALWRRPSWLGLQAAALVGCAFTAFAAGPYAVPPLGVLALGVLTALALRRSERRRLEHDRAERQTDLGARIAGA